MYWTLELASSLDDAPWPATKEELIDYATRTCAPEEVVENLEELDEDGEIYDMPGFAGMGRTGRTNVPLTPEDLVPLPESASLCWIGPIRWEAGASAASSNPEWKISSPVIRSRCSMG